MAKTKRNDDLNYAHELLKKFDLNPKQSIKKMSKGMKQKLIDLISKHKRMGATIFLSTHISEEVERTCDRVMMIRQGKIVSDSLMHHQNEIIKENTLIIIILGYQY